MDQAPGWYGKLPALGDFARRRLPPEFVEPWDRWLQQCLQASRTTLADTWLEHYLGAHVWHFVLMPGVIGPTGWAGVLMPSVDRVGRYFPLTLCTGLPAKAALGSSLAALSTWLKGLESIALLGLDAASGLDLMESALQAAPLPVAAEPGDSLNPSDGAGFRVFGDAASPVDFLDGLAARVLPDALAGQSLWWCHGADGASGGFVHRGLPAPAVFTGMLAYVPGGWTPRPTETTPQLNE